MKELAVERDGRQAKIGSLGVSTRLSEMQQRQHGDRTTQSGIAPARRRDGAPHLDQPRGGGAPTLYLEDDACGSRRGISVSYPMPNLQQGDTYPPRSVRDPHIGYPRTRRDSRKRHFVDGCCASSTTMAKTGRYFQQTTRRVDWATFTRLSKCSEGDCHHMVARRQ